MGWIPSKPKDVVCRERAKAFAEKKHNEEISRLEAQWIETRNGAFFAKKQQEERARAKTEKDMFAYFMDNYVIGMDNIIREEDKKRHTLAGLKKASDILLDALRSL